MKKYFAAAFLLSLGGCAYDNGYYDNFGHYHYYDINHTRGNEDNKWDGNHAEDWDPEDNHDWHNPGTRNDRYYDHNHNNVRYGHSRDDD